jgi:hypothetical protein
MPADAKRVVVSTGQTTQYGAHHHDYPELRAEGESAEDAVANLVVDLEREIEAAADELHREPLRRALADARAFGAAHG